MLCNLVLASIVTPAFAVQRSVPLLHSCENGDCYFGFDATSPNESDFAFGDQICQCCWRDCNLDSEPIFHVETLHKASLEDNESASDVDAWLLMAHCGQHLDWNLFTPIIETVKTALESKGSVTRVIGLADLHNMIDGIKAAVAQGKRPLVLSVGHQWAGTNADEKLEVYKQIKQAKKAGAYVVAYQTEPVSNRWTRDGSLTRLVYAMGMAQYFGADEIWDYSRAQSELYPPASKYGVDDFIIRYVPPGYSPKMDVGVDINSDGIDAQGIGYMGSMGRKSMSAKYSDIFREDFHPTNKIWSEMQLRTFLERWPLQLNMHKNQTCCPRESWEDDTQHVEAFRMSALLANKVCVISPPSAKKDMQEFQGMINFAEVEETAATMARLSKSLADCRQRSYETFKRVFAAEALLEKSGFFKTWLPPHGK